MKNRIFVRTILMFLALICLCSTKAFSNSSNNSNSWYDAPFVKITDDKHYIMPGSIVFSEDGLFLVMQGHLIPIKSVETDNNGVFIRAGEYQHSLCPGCNRPLTPGGICVNRNCPFSPYYDPD